MAYGVARGDDKGAEEAAVLGGLDADAVEDEGVVEVEAGRGGSRDFLRGGGGLEAAPHRVRVHMFGGAPGRRGGEVAPPPGRQNGRWSSPRHGRQTRRVDWRRRSLGFA